MPDETTAPDDATTPAARRTDGSAFIAASLGDPFDAALSDANRLRIQAALHGLPVDGSMRFTALAKALHLSDGNLAAHLAVLSEVGYVSVETTYSGKRRTRWFAASPAGRAAFEAHVRALQSIVDAARLAAAAGEPPRGR